MGLFGSLGLDKVADDPNAWPDSTYSGIIVKSSYVFLQKTNEIAHVITYKVTEGQHAGKENPEFWKLGKNPTKDENGNWTSLGENVMTDQRKSFYKKRLMSLGVPESRMDDFDPKDIEGLEVIFKTKKNGDFLNFQETTLRSRVVAPGTVVGDAGIAGGDPLAGMPTTPPVSGGSDLADSI